MAGKVGSGVVGGSIGIRGALNHLMLPDVQDKAYVATVCDPVPGRAKAAAQKYGVLGHYERYEELLADPQVDAVTLGSPIGLHYEQGLKAVEAGKHVHFNKTMCLTVAEADHLIERATAKKARLVASPGVMLHPHARRMRQLVLEGRLGTLVWAAAGAAISTYHLDEEVRQGDDPLTNIDPSGYFKRPAGGPLYDVTVYSLHHLTGIVWPARRVSAMSGPVVPEREFPGRKVPCRIGLPLRRHRPDAGPAHHLPAPAARPTLSRHGGMVFRMGRAHSPKARRHQDTKASIHHRAFVVASPAYADERFSSAVVNQVHEHFVVPCPTLIEEVSGARSGDGRERAVWPVHGRRAARQARHGPLLAPARGAGDG